MVYSLIATGQFCGVAAPLAAAPNSLRVHPGAVPPRLRRIDADVVGGTTDQLNGVNAINAHSLLVVGVKMRPVMWRTGFGIHANNNPKKAGKFWHDLIIPQGSGVVVSLCCGAERCASAAPGSRSAAEAVRRRLQAVVRGFGGCAATHVEGTGQPVHFFLLYSWEDRGSS